MNTPAKTDIALILLNVVHNVTLNLYSWLVIKLLQVVNVPWPGKWSFIQVLQIVCTCACNAGNSVRPFPSQG